MTNFEMVKEFHKAMGLPIGGFAQFTTPAAIARRNRLMLEELSEYNKAVSECDLLEIADALGDLLYVVYGSGIEHGFDMDKIFKEIHRSNMTKSEGKLDRSGKLIKPDNYEAPNLNFLLEE